jgi:hypothetical protein
VLSMIDNDQAEAMPGSTVLDISCEYHFREKTCTNVIAPVRDICVWFMQTTRGKFMSTLLDVLKFQLEPILRSLPPESPSLTSTGRCALGPLCRLHSPSRTRTNRLLSGVSVDEL